MKQETEEHQVNLSEDIKNGVIEFQECSWESVKHLFLGFHYLKSMPAGIMAAYGIFDKLKLGVAVGGAVFCNGRIQYENKYIEFSRLFVLDKYGKNTESWFMSKCLKALKKKYPKYEGVVTWADCSKGHNGTVYRAANFVYDGESRKVNKFIGKNKKVVYERTSEKGSIKIGQDNPKKRFIYYFDNKKRESLKAKRSI